MDQPENNAAKISFVVKHSNSQIAEVTSPGGTKLGQAVSAHQHRPRRLVAGTVVRARSACQRLLFLAKHGADAIPAYRAVPAVRDYAS